MPDRKRRILFWIFSFMLTVTSAQETPAIEFGKVRPADFGISAAGLSANTAAVVIADLGKLDFEGFHNGLFVTLFTRIIRVKILDIDRFNAVTQIPYLDYKDGNEEKITNLRGITFNQENGSIQQVPLNDKEVTIETLSKYHEVKKFRMPALKTGTVFDISYTIRSNLLSEPVRWRFQGSYPCLWSELTATIPSMFHYMIRTTGDDHYDLKTKRTVNKVYLMHGSGGELGSDNTVNLACTAFQERWIKKNIPVLPLLPYTSALKNYESSISFVLEYFKLDDRNVKDLEIKTWSQQSAALWKMKYFGLELDQDNRWLDEELSGITLGSTSSDEETDRIFHWVRDHFKRTDSTAFYVNNSLKDVYKNHTGNEAELNLLLTAMLRHRKIQAYPAILSTRQNGFASLDIPLVNDYNYVICAVRSGDRIFTLDASSPLNGFGKLPGYCYNGGARMIDEKNPTLIGLSGDSVTDEKMTSVLIINEENGKLSGTAQTEYTDHAYFSKRKESRETDYNLKDSLKFHFNPVLETEFKLNPFTDSTRLYPVSFPGKMDHMYVLSLELPRGFPVIRLPKSARVNLNENQGLFEYLIQQNGDHIQMKIHIKLNEAVFLTEDYASLRNFFAFIAAKEQEYILFGK